MAPGSGARSPKAYRQQLRSPPVIEAHFPPSELLATFLSAR
ncbi:MAG: hypothetical protein AVDCRST_MAG93-943 [uncultured Chloroflexia bacterium]|uniref:Uncharacterized protein n=1 Tax=uncultured Chloroflexia bacterium TaxID=1672391 RepID=A0A6J4HUQ2_9CHLR|nr:MAG: hypothetical protein AVDCRST_MAG93-943 [uncultured Chloroflexia bacterium]